MHVPYSRFLGYDKGENTLIINKEQASIVKRIYFLYLKGYSPYSIAETLTKEKIKSPGGKMHWNASNIKSILSNEKYKGDALLQKSFTVDFLTKKKKKNEGEVQQYYITDNHEPIIDKEIFEIVQDDLKTRKYKRTICTNFFSGQIVCKDCNSIYSPKVFHSTDKYKKRVFQCLNKQKNKCKTPNLTEDEIKEAFIKAANIVISKKEDIIKTYEKVVNKSFDTRELDEKLISLNQKLIELEKKASDFIKENSKEVKDQDTYEKNYNELIKKYDNTKSKIVELEDKIREQKLKKATLIKYISDLKTAKLIKKFDEDMWRAMVVKVYVDDNGKLEFEMKNGERVIV